MSKNNNKDFILVTIHAKLEKTVLVLLDYFMSECIKTILIYRTQFGDKLNDEHVFSTVITYALKRQDFRTRPLMRKFAEEYEATMP